MTSPNGATTQRRTLTQRQPRIAAQGGEQEGPAGEDEPEPPYRPVILIGVSAVVVSTSTEALGGEVDVEVSTSAAASQPEVDAEVQLAAQACAFIGET